MEEDRGRRAKRRRTANVSLDEEGKRYRCLVRRRGSKFQRDKDGNRCLGKGGFANAFLDEEEKQHRSLEGRS